jgi:LysR family transcriptional regulator, glycine cleavage system transcriptional activator
MLEAMPTRLPAFPSLRAFEATARLGSVTRAAAELGVSQPAVSQQLRQLEAFLERPLLRRVGGSLVLTAAGELYALRLRRALEELQGATDELLATGAEARVLTLSLLATFAQRWLIPRLAGFQRAHPDLEVRLLTTSRLVDLAREDVDLSIRAGSGRWPGCRADFLIENQIFPVASPALLARRPVHRPADLAAQVLVRVEAEPRDRDWQRWLTAAGVPALEPRGWLTFASSSHALEAAIAGLGVAIGHTPFVTDGLAAGRLAAPLALEVGGGGDFFLVAARAKADRRKIIHFRDWLLAECRARPGSLTNPGG